MLNRELEVFLDAECTKPISEIHNDKEFVKTGTSKEWVVYVKNVYSLALADIEFFSTDMDLHIEPSRIGFMASGEVRKLTLVWSVPKCRLDALHALISYTAKAERRLHD